MYKKIILFLLCIIPFNCFALSFSPKENLTIEVGSDFEKLYDYTYYHYVKTENAKGLYCQNGSSSASCYLLRDTVFSSNNFSGQDYEYGYVNGNNVYLVPPEQTTSSNIYQKQITYPIENNNDIWSYGTPTENSYRSSSTYGNLTAGLKIYSLERIYTDSNKTALYNFNSVYQHSFRGFSDIESYYENYSDSSSGNVNVNVDIDYTIFYIIATIIMIFFLTWFLLKTFPLKGGKNL